MSNLRVAIVGAGGRMGGAILRLAAADASWTIAAAVERADDPRIGQDAGAAAGAATVGVRLSAHIDAPCDVVIEFSKPESCVEWAAWAATHGCAFVSGTTGLSEQQHQRLAEHAAEVPLLWSPNMGVGINVLLEAIGRIAAMLGPDWDIEICEAHHSRKVDAPSGTANALLEAICRGLGRDAGSATVHGRSGTPGPRRPGEIGMHAMRMGDVVGDHEVFFATTGEVVSVRHRATSRDVFAAGALRAARWVAGRAPGLYNMRNVVGAP